MLEFFAGFVLSIMAMAVLFYKKRLIVDDYLGETRSYKINLDSKSLSINTLKLLTDVTREFKCICGEMNYKFWGRLEVVEKINEFKNKNIQGRVLCGPKIDPEIVKLLKQWIQDGVLAVKKVSQREEYHFIVSDNRHFKAEVPHEPFEKIRKGIVVLNAQDREDISRLENRFEHLWEKSEEISFPEDVEKFEIAHNTQH